MVPSRCQFARIHPAHIVTLAACCGLLLVYSYYSEFDLTSPEKYASEAISINLLLKQVWGLTQKETFSSTDMFLKDMSSFMQSAVWLLAIILFSRLH